MKQLIRMLFGLMIGVIAGLAIGGLISVLFTDITISEYVASVCEIDSGAYRPILAAILALALSILILIPAHEAGHLVCGLISGYKFVSFRIFNLTFIKAGGKIRVKNFAIAGTGGQCLLAPPDLPIERIPVTLYNAGGVLVNILLLLIAIPLFFFNLSPYAAEMLSIFCMIDFFIILTNGIPMKIGGIANDAHNILHLRRDLLAKRGLLMQLRVNALVQEGVRPKDMPDEWFVVPEGINWKNPLEVSLPAVNAGRLLDEMKFEEAYNEFSHLYGHRNEIIQLYVNEMACELAFCALVTGRTKEAEALLDQKLRQYIKTYAKVMSGKQRLLWAIALYLEGNHAKAGEILCALEANRSKYLLQGEVASDLAIIKTAKSA